MGNWSVEERQAQLDELREAWSICENCQLCQTRANTVFGEGPADARIMLIGEAPGADEDAAGQPFVGPSGELLDMVLDGAGVLRDRLYITNLVACRPPENRQPLRDEKASCWIRLAQQIYIVDPLVIVPVGKEALQALVHGRSLDMKNSHGKLFGEAVKLPNPPCQMFPRKDDKKVDWSVTYDVIPIYHPAYALRIDSYDYDKHQWAQGSIALQMRTDLKFITDRVNRLSDIYDKAEMVFFQQE